MARWRFAAGDPVVVRLGSMFTGAGTVLAQPAGESPFYTVEAVEQAEPVHVEERFLTPRIPDNVTVEQMEAWLARR